MNNNLPGARLVGAGILLMSICLSRSVSAQCEVIMLDPPELRDQDRYGTSVDIQGDTIIVGAPGRYYDNPRPGYADVFREHKGVWRHEVRLASPIGYPTDLFGSSVLLVNDLAIITAPRDFDGRVNVANLYVFKRSGKQWNLREQLKTGLSGFSTSLATDGRRVLLGHPSADRVLVYRLQGKKLLFTQELIPSDCPALCWGSGFGSAVAIDGDRIIVGRIGDWDNGGDGVGSAYIFRFNPTTQSYLQEAKLLPAGFQPYLFGMDVEIVGDVALVSQEIFLSFDVQVFHAQGNQWSLQQRIFPPNLGGFNPAMALEGSKVLIASQNCNPKDIPWIPCIPGRAHLYRSDPETGQWSHELPMRIDGLFPGNEVPPISGRSIEMDGDVAVMGSPGSTFNAVRSGLAFVFTGLDSRDENNNDRPDACDVSGDITGDGLVNVSDLLALLGAWGSCSQCPADLDQSGTVNVTDLMILIAAWKP